jgi:DNA-binding response OmpR family regulator
MTKPFSPRELTARVRALLRRPRWLAAAGPGAAAGPDAAAEPGAARPDAAGAGAARLAQAVPPAPPSADELVFGALVIDRAAREARLAGQDVQLTRTEFDLLAALAAEPRRVYTREQLLRSVWGPNWVGDPHAVDVHLGAVRRKLGDTAQRQRYVRTVRGVGYRMGAGR